MVTAAPPKTHAHRFEIIKNRGTCKCGEIREYTGEGRDSTFRVIQPGEQDFKDSPGQPVTNPVEKLTETVTREETPVIKAQIVPPKPETVPASTKLSPPSTPYARMKWIKEHREEILADFVKMGRQTTQDKWGW